MFPFLGILAKFLTRRSMKTLGLSQIKEAVTGKPPAPSCVSDTPAPEGQLQPTLETSTGVAMGPPCSVYCN